MGWLQQLLDWLNRFKPKPPPIPIPPTPTPDVGLVAALNTQRQAVGLEPLAEDVHLSAIAQEWATHMAETGILTHGDFLGRISAAFPRTAAAEDIAEGQPDVASVVASWMASSGHRANILGDFNRVGWGMARDAVGITFWNVDFVLV